MTRFAVLGSLAGQDTWTYASLAAAESSGDPWTDGNTINITGGASFKYYSALDTNGHSGLIHADPFNQSQSISTVALTNAEGSGTDPDSWGAEWSDTGTGVKDTDYSWTASGGYSEINKLTTAGRARIEPNSMDSGHTSTFLILRSAKVTETATTNLFTATAYCFAYEDASNQDYCYVAQVGDESGWKAYDNEGSTAFGTASSDTDLWMYVRAGRVAIWADDDASPIRNGTEIASAAEATRPLHLTSGNAGSNYTSTLHIKTVLYGTVTAS